MDLLRIATAGSVDDGKSTLIGRLLYDSKQVFEDTLASLQRASAAQGLGHGEQVERVEGHGHRVSRGFMDTGASGKAFADDEYVLRLTDHQVAALDTPARMEALAALLIDQLQAVQGSVRVLHG